MIFLGYPCLFCELSTETSDNLRIFEKTITRKHVGLYTEARSYVFESIRVEYKLALGLVQLLPDLLLAMIKLLVLRSVKDCNALI